MTTPAIRKELAKYLNDEWMNNLRMGFGDTGPHSIIMCMTVAKICREYKSTQKNEDRVSLLLANYCKNHFNKKPAKKR